MKKKQNLTKENFWDDVAIRFPKAFYVFTQWLDEWKNTYGTNNWVDFSIPVEPKDIKFHDYPYAMQLGIMIEFMVDKRYINCLSVTGQFMYYTDGIFLKVLVETVFEAIERNDRTPFDVPVRKFPT